MVINKSNITIDGSDNRPILIDTTFNQNEVSRKVVVFSHGFKGFKDWGPFNKIATYFAQQDFVFVKFNFSYNGTTPTNPVDFDDLKAFGENNFSKELDDLSLVLDWIKKCDILRLEVDENKISLFGHSRGGGISMLRTTEDNSIAKVISWASPANFLISLPTGKKLEKLIET